MLRALDVPFLDAAADQLVWRLGAPARPALATMGVDLPRGWSLDLRLLGASHQVIVRDAGAIRCSEVVACDAAAAGDLPPVADRCVGGLDYRFTSRVVTTTPDALAALASELRARARRSTMLVGAFPGSPHAMTAVEVVDGGWRTWHLYPQAGEVVTTATTLTGRP